jgi:hypothetical protein
MFLIRRGVEVDAGSPGRVYIIVCARLGNGFLPVTFVDFGEGARRRV